jgi:hypothetical protein
MEYEQTLSDKGGSARLPKPLVDVLFPAVLPELLPYRRQLFAQLVY